MIGVALLLFLLGDLFSSGGNMFRQTDNIVGEIAGKEITQREYELRVQEAIDQQFGVDGANEQAKAQIRERVWRDLIKEIITEKELQNLGISVSPDELLDQVKNTQPGSILSQYFTDPNTGQIIEQFRDPNTGALDSQIVLAAIQNILNSDNASQWLPIEAAIKEDVARSKYANLIGKGLYTTTAQAKNIYEEKNTTLSFSYVLKEYNSIPVEEVEVTDADIKEYYNAHKSEETYQNQDETRDILLTSYELIPSEEDVQEIIREMEEIKAMFAVDSNDTAFVLENAEGDLANLIRYTKEDAISPVIKDTLINSSIGSVFGPYRDGMSMKVSKLLGIKMSPDSVQASHILIRVDDGDTNKIAAARLKLDSLKKVAMAQNNFAELAKEFSDDLGSGEKGGELDWFTKGRMVPPFEKAAFDGKTGDMPIVESQFGVHLIHITDQTAPLKNYLIASVDMLVEPSKYTADNIYKEASRFAVDHNSIEKFESAEREVFPVEGLRVEEEGLGALGGVEAKQVIRWAFNDETEVGQVSAPFELDDRIVVATLTKVRVKGTMTLESATGIIRPIVLREKRAEMIKNQLGDFSSLDDAAANLGVKVRSLESARMSDQALGSGIGREPKLLGTLATLDQGSISKPVEGNRGVFVLRLDSMEPAPEDGDIETEKTIANNNNFSRASRNAQTALEKAVGVEDNRVKYY
ncbi:MAG: SurA N-terminal domain-containing protein [Salibacteraceae bacterium]